MSDHETLATAWWTMFKNSHVTVNAVIRAAYVEPAGPEIAALRAAIRQVAPSDLAAGLLSPQRLGQLLSRLENAPLPLDTGLDAYPLVAFVRCGTDRGLTAWQLQPREATPSVEDEALSEATAA